MFVIYNIIIKIHNVSNSILFISPAFIYYTEVVEDATKRLIRMYVGS